MNIFNRFKSLCENILGGPLPKQPEEKELTQKQIERILWYHEEVSKTIRRVFYILVGSCLFWGGKNGDAGKKWGGGRMGTLVKN